MCQPGTEDSNLYSALREGLRLDLIGERWRAIQSIEELISQHPDFGEARGHLAWIYSLQGNNPLAIGHLEEVLRIDGENSDVRSRVEHLEAEWDQWEKGNESRDDLYERAVALIKDESRGIQPRQREAAILFRLLWERADHKDSAVWFSRLAFAHQDFPKCLEATEECLRRSPNETEFPIRLGLIHEHMGNPELAVQAYREVLSRHPGAHGIRSNLVALGEGSSESIPNDYPLAPLFSVQERGGEPVHGRFRGRSLKAIVKSFLTRELSVRKRAERRSKRLAKNPDYGRTACNLCGNRRYLGEAIGRENGWSILRCAKCGLVQTQPQPTQETLTRKYQEQYYDTGSIETARGIHEAPPIGETQMTMLPRVMDFLVRHGLEGYESCLGDRRMLDVGCGEGVLMRDFRIRGWECEGTEVSAPAIDFLREKAYVIHPGLLEDLSIPEGSFHLVTLSHVIEHVRDPLGYLRRIHSLLVPGGWVFVTTPCTDSVPSRVAGEDWYYDPDHIFFFSRKTLAETMRSAGFHVFGSESYVGVGQETWDEAWLREGLGPTIKGWVEKTDQGDVLLMVGKKSD